MLHPNRHFSPVKLFIDRTRHVGLMLNPKVLTTFTRSMLADGYCEHHGLTDPSDNRHPHFSVPRRFPVASVRDYVDFFKHPESYDVFAFVRNPYARLVSAWRSKFEDVCGNGQIVEDSTYPRSVRKRHLKPLRQFALSKGWEGSEPGSPVPFATFLHYVAERPEGSRDHHWDYQSAVLMCDRLAYHRIYRIEDELEAGFLDFGDRIGFPADWVRERLGQPQNRSSKGEKVYTVELSELARELCQADLARFGYEENSWQRY